MSGSELVNQVASDAKKPSRYRSLYRITMTRRANGFSCRFAGGIKSEVQVKVLALDLEGTLISNAVSQIPRPGLFDFLEDCRRLFPRIVIFTAVNEVRFRSIANYLCSEGYAPNWFAEIEYITWSGDAKNLFFIKGGIVPKLVEIFLR